MKKSKLSLGLISCLLSVGTLAGCDTLKSSSDGVLLSYTVDGVEGKITADEILGDYYNDSTKYQAIYDTIYSVIARNYFTKEREPAKVIINGEEQTIPLGKSQMAKIERDAREKVSDDKDTAQSNADTNNTKYKKEFEAILESKGVETEEELFDKYVEELQKETFENNFYTYKIEEIKNASNGDNISVKGSARQSIAVKSLADDTNVFEWNGYFEDQLPYHMSHILVKLADSSDTNYYNGTISEDNAERLYNVISELGSGDKTFAKIAKTYNEDPGSKDKEGDLGIMDLDTSFVNPFKLGIYAYELFYNANTKDAASDSNIKVSTGAGSIEENYKKAVANAFGIGEDEIPTVDKSVFDELKTYAKDDTDENGKSVIENATLVYPRNIIYNKYLNRHAVFFIENKNFDPANPGNFVQNWGGYAGKNILCANGDKTKPIIAVRASSGGEQEIHLMVVNRSPFATKGLDKDGNEVDLISLSNYYTTYYPAQEDYYPKDANGKKLDTYVNFLTNDPAETKNRAEEFASKLKSYNSDKLGKYIFLKYANEEHIQFAEENKALAEALMKWISTSIQKSSEEKEESWTKTWNEYLDKLVRQNSERKKLVPQACKLVYKKANTDTVTSTLLSATEQAELASDILASGAVATQAEAEAKAAEYLAQKASEWFKTEGGLCNDGKAHL